MASHSGQVDILEQADTAGVNVGDYMHASRYGTYEREGDSDGMREVDSDSGGEED